jgi:hypothetical protein
MVHRAAMAEVFLTDAVSLGGGSFLVAAQWPRDHALYHPDAAGRSDPLLFAETVRQAIVYLAHQYHGVPLTHRFVGRDIEFEITDPDALRAGAAPLPVVLEASWHWDANRPPSRYGMRLEVVLSVYGEPCGRASLRVLAVDGKRYGLMRSRRVPREARPEPDVPSGAPALLPPSLVGRLRAKDSVLVRGRQDGEWELGLDLDHAVLFDHPSDHIPLMVTLEGIRQLGHLLAHASVGDGGTRGGVVPALVGLRTDCLAFGELDAPVRLVLREDAEEPAGGPTRAVRIGVVQNGTVLAESVSRWRLEDGVPR